MVLKVNVKQNFKILQRKFGEHFFDHGIRKCFLHMTQKSQFRKEKINKLIMKF